MVKKEGIFIILLFMFPCFFLNICFNLSLLRRTSINSYELNKKTIIWTDVSGDVTDFSGVATTHDPVDIITIDENAQMSVLNVSFTGTPASGSTPSWFYIYALYIDKDHDNSTTEYTIQFFKIVGGSPSCTITRTSDNYYWDGTGWSSSPYSDPNFVYITSNNMVFNFSSCLDLIDDNWYNIDARFTDGGGSGYIDLGIGGVGTGPMYFAGNSSGQDKNPPQIENARIIPSVGLNGTDFVIKVNVSDPSNVSSVVASIKYSNETVIQNLSLFDDGAHFDGNANDSLYGNLWSSIGQPNGTYYVDIWANDTVGNSIKFANAKFFLIGAVAATGLFDGLYYNWTGIFNVGMTSPWYGSEEYQFLEGNIFTNNHYDSQNGQGDWLTDNATRILVTSQPFWGTNVHDHIFISSNTTLNENISINIAGADSNCTVTGTADLQFSNTNLTCWELTDSGGSLLYYEKETGLLINGTFQLGMGFYYTIILNSTNAVFRIPPTISIIQPENTTYTNLQLPVIVANSTNIESAWYRQSINGITWSNNYSLSYNGTYFKNISCQWVNGLNLIQVFANNSFGDIMTEIEWFTVDIIPPNISVNSPMNITYNKNIIDINLLSSSPDLDTIWYRIYCYTDGIWIDAGNVSWFNPIQRNLSDGYYAIHTWANDTLGNELIYPKIINFTIDTPPQIISISITNETKSTTGSLLLNISIDAADLDTIWYRIFNGTSWITGNITWTGAITLLLSNGDYLLYIWVNDTQGNEISVVISFTVQITPPKGPNNFIWIIIIIIGAIASVMIVYKTKKSRKKKKSKAKDIKAVQSFAERVKSID